jgi:hypothetical protein
VFHKELSTGSFSLALQDNVAAKKNFSFTPPKFGWYAISYSLYHQGQLLRTYDKYISVTPRFSGMVALGATETTGGWANADSPDVRRLAQHAFGCKMLAAARLNSQRTWMKLDSS